MFRVVSSHSRGPSSGKALAAALSTASNVEELLAQCGLSLDDFELGRMLGSNRKI